MKARLIAILLVALLALSGAAMAQKEQAGARRGDKAAPLAKIAKHLDLSQDQIQRIREIVAKYHADVKGVMASAVPDAEKRTKIAALKTTAADAIMALLTPEQQEKAKKIRLTELLLNPKARDQGRMLWALGQLDLTETQKTTIKRISDESREQAKAIRGDKALDEKTKKTKALELRKATEQKVLGVLTPEQQTKLKELLAKPKGPKPDKPGRDKTTRMAE